MTCKMGSLAHHQRQEQQDSGAMFSESSATTIKVLGCYNVQHDGGTGQKPVEDIISDVNHGPLAGNLKLFSRSPNNPN